ncbi:MAG: MFS transporter [Chloroflexota bacterium]
MPLPRLNDTTKQLVSLYIPSVAMSFGQSMVAPTIPLLAASFNVSLGLSAQVVTAQVLGRILSNIPAGMFIDSRGRRPAMIGGGLMVAAAALATILTPDFLALLVAQFVAGAGSNTWQMAREVAAMDLVKPEQRGRLITSLYGLSTFGLVTGPVLGGVLSDGIGYRAVFWAYLAMAVAVAPVTFLLKETKAPGVRTPRSGWSIGRLGDIHPYFRPTFIILMIGTFFTVGRRISLNVMLPLFVVGQLGHSATEVGSLFAVVGVMNLVMVLPAGYLSDKIGRKATVVPGALLSAVAFAVYGAVDGMPALAVLSAVYGIANGLDSGSLTTYTYDIAPEDGRAKMQSLRRIAADSGMLAAPFVGGLVANEAGASHFFGLLAPFLAVFGLVTWFVARESLDRKRPPALCRINN